MSTTRPRRSHSALPMPPGGVRIGTTNVAADSQVAAFLDQAPFHGGLRLMGPSAFRQCAVAVVALRGFTNERSSFSYDASGIGSRCAVSTGKRSSFRIFAEGRVEDSGRARQSDGRRVNRKCSILHSAGAATLTVGGQSGSSVLHRREKFPPLPKLGPWRDTG
jgi:hypothetical protein